MDGRSSDELPSSERRALLLDRLAEMSAKHGIEPLVAWPIIAPEFEHFPDTLEPFSRQCVLRLLRRLLWYTGLEAMRVELEMVDSSIDVDVARRPVVALVAIDEARCAFQCDAPRATSAEALIGAAARAIVTVFRARELGTPMKSKSAAEATDYAAYEGDVEAIVASTYLGFGLLFCAEELRDRDRHARRKDEALARDDRDAAYMLAVWCYLRSLNDADLDYCGSKLDDASRAVFRASLAHLDDEAEALASRLRLPPSSEWPEAESVDELIEMKSTQPQDLENAEALAFERIGKLPPNTGDTRWMDVEERERERFSVAWSNQRTMQGAMIGLAIGALPLLVGVYGGVIGLPIVGGLIGMTMSRDRCGTHGCYGRVMVNKPCPKCGKLAVRQEHPWV